MLQAHTARPLKHTAKPIVLGLFLAASVLSCLTSSWSKAFTIALSSSGWERLLSYTQLNGYTFYLDLLLSE
jgi:hypothetical protein